jgi:hypothetical protein
MPRLATPTDPEIQIPDTSSLTWWKEFNNGKDNWNKNIQSAGVDAQRTAALANLHQNVRCRTAPTSVPLQNVDLFFTKVYEATVPPTLTNWFPSKRVPLPPVVYILSNTDEQWFGLDKKNSLLWECSAIGPTLLGWPAPWRADTIRTWDLKVDWRLQKSGMVGAGVPMWPMVPKPEDLLAGKDLGHSLHFVAAGYNKGEKVGIATKTDGETVGHPLRAGERLRLRWDRVPVCKNLAERTLVSALLTYGLILTDKTDDSPLGPGHSIRLPKDPRITIDLDLSITDFEVLAQ